MIAVEAAMKKMSPQELQALPGLDEEDYKVFGTFIQHFCFIDLDFRWVLEIFESVKMLPTSAAKAISRLAGLALAATLIEIVKRMDVKTENIPMSLELLEGMSKARKCRESRRALRRQVDDPSFAAPIYANLFDDEGGEGNTLIWSRSRKVNAD